MQYRDSILKLLSSSNDSDQQLALLYCKQYLTPKERKLMFYDFVLSRGTYSMSCTPSSVSHIRTDLTPLNTNPDYPNRGRFYQDKVEIWVQDYVVRYNIIVKILDEFLFIKFIGWTKYNSLRVSTSTDFNEEISHQPNIRHRFMRHIWKQFRHLFIDMDKFGKIS